MELVQLKKCITIHTILKSIITNYRYLGYDNEEGSEIAWNTILVSTIPEGDRKRLQGELQLLNNLRHKYILRLYSYWYIEKPQSLIMIIEKINGGSIAEFIKGKELTLKVIKKWCIQILEALNYLHSQIPRIIHRDLKCENILYDSINGNIRIGDFGLSIQACQGRTVIGTPEYMAPELYTSKPYNEKVDIYAFGLCLCQLLTGEAPYFEYNSIPDIMSAVISVYYYYYTYIWVGKKIKFVISQPKYFSYIFTFFIFFNYYIVFIIYIYLD